MTLIAAIEQPGFHCLISDSRVVRSGTHEGHNDYLKTGILFPGCIYGMCGDVNEAIRFIRSFKEIVRANAPRPLPDRWNQFTSYVAQYKFSDDPNDLFVLLLSERSEGDPRSWKLSSDNGELSPSPNQGMKSGMGLSLFGSGSAILDDDLKRLYENRVKSIPECLEANGIDRNLAYKMAPYFVSLWLSEYTLGENEYDMLQVDVGGLFTFSYVTSMDEGRQESSYYVIASVDSTTKQVEISIYKYAPLSLGIGIVRLRFGAESPPVIFSNDAADYDSGILTENDLRALVEEFHKAQKKFTFCGLGFHQRKYQGLVNGIANGTASDIWDTDGKFTTTLQHMVNSAISSRSGP